MVKLVEMDVHTRGSCVLVSQYAAALFGMHY